MLSFLTEPFLAGLIVGTPLLLVARRTAVLPITDAGTLALVQASAIWGLGYGLYQFVLLPLSLSRVGLRTVELASLSIQIPFAVTVAVVGLGWTRGNQSDRWTVLGRWTLVAFSGQLLVWWLNFGL